jgi:orotidine-5'-phosphate decarboxylase
VTVNPYLGRDSVQPFLDRADRGVVVLCRTSNPGAGDLQDLVVHAGEGVARPLYQRVAEKVARGS